MSVSIRLKRFGSKKRPFYRVVVIDSREAIKGAPLEEIGVYHPIEVQEKQVSIDPERAAYWLQNGAQPSNTVRNLFSRQGIQVSRKAPVKD